jgi:hypothetical protein
MRPSHRWLVAGLYVAALLLAGCGPWASAQGTVEKEAPSRLEPIAGTELSRVILTEEAADRLDIHTEEVRETDVEGQPHRVISYTAVIYDVEGTAWAYTSPEPYTFVRLALDIDAIDGDLAILSEGPPVGTPVVTVGAAELYGAEFEFQEG